LTVPSATKDSPPPLPPAEHIRSLVEANQVAEARRYAAERLAMGDESVEAWARHLRPPEVRPSAYRPRRDFGADHAWLRENRDAFLGRWVALSSGKLLDTDARLDPLVERLTARGIIEGVLVTQVF
jgi:hypothetical protein